MATNITPLTQPRRGITETELCGWLGQAVPGDRLAYHRGFLALDCMSTNGRLSEADRGELRRVARRALFAAESGLAHLVQRRNGPDDFTYLVIARPRPKTARGSILSILAAEAA